MAIKLGDTMTTFDEAGSAFHGVLAYRTVHICLTCLVRFLVKNNRPRYHLMAEKVY